MKFQFGNFIEVDTKGLVRFCVFFSFSRWRMGKSDLFKAKEETRRTTKNYKMNNNIFRKY